MTKWIRISEKFPTKFPCKGRNYQLHIEDVITGFDENNQARGFHFYCKSLPIPGISIAFTHWMPIDG